MVKLAIALVAAFQLHATTYPSNDRVWTDIWINPGVYDPYAPLTLRIERSDGKEPTEQDVQNAFKAVNRQP